ncbi:MAG: hypothetical protein IK047_01130 [Clostridia bacterium]|nr:hypothetical protein [Clostridia bacterium]
MDNSCETCEFYVEDGETGDFVCSALLDEDDYAEFLRDNAGKCKYYRFYDEYKTVQKQN